jgi:hypothetical protein
MTTVIRAEISEKNKYWINKHRHYELKHFCLQYESWKKSIEDLDGFKNKTGGESTGSSLPGDPTNKCVELRTGYLDRVELIERIAYETDPVLHKYILKAVTEGLSYTYLKSKLGIPCGRDMYYDRYRKFFWLLSESRN